MAFVYKDQENHTHNLRSKSRASSSVVNQKVENQVSKRSVLGVINADNTKISFSRYKKVRIEFSYLCIAEHLSYTQHVNNIFSRKYRRKLLALKLIHLPSTKMSKHHLRQLLLEKKRRFRKNRHWRSLSLRKTCSQYVLFLVCIFFRY